MQIEKVDMMIKAGCGRMIRKIMNKSYGLDVDFEDPWNSESDGDQSEPPELY